MTDVDIAFDEYRECLRMVWNTALRFRPFADAELPQLSDMLLKALVFDVLRNPTEDNASRTGIGYWPCLSIRPLSREIMTPHRNGEDVKWLRQSIPPLQEKLLFPFIDLFDFRTTPDPRDFEYVLGYWAPDAEAPANGESFLILRSHVEMVDVT